MPSFPVGRQSRVSQSAAADRGEAATLSLDPLARSRRRKNVSANFGARGGECLRLERNDALRRAWIVGLRSCFRASAGVWVRSASSEVERHQILDVVIWRAPRSCGVNTRCGSHDGLSSPRFFEGNPRSMPSF
jgi:hypothetical protein